ncbi:MAG: SRPBCC family protein [Campylobacterota bacterium]
MRIFEKECILPAPIEDAFAFHTDIINLPRLSPPDTLITIRNTDAQIKKGQIIKLKALKGYTSMNWEVCIKDVQAPYLLVDEAVKSPFKFWRHSHEFLEHGIDQTLMRDVVEFELPFGIIGKMFENYVIKELDTMFAYRHRATQELLA